MAESAPMETDTTPKEKNDDVMVESSDNTKEETIKEEDKAASGSDTAGSAGRGQKREYTEEERLKRKAYFKELREKRIAKYKRKDQLFPRRPVKKAVELSFNISEEENKILDHYVLRLSILKGENESLHKTLTSLVQENMKLLKMGPPLTGV